MSASSSLADSSSPCWLRDRGVDLAEPSLTSVSRHSPQSLQNPEDEASKPRYPAAAPQVTIASPNTAQKNPGTPYLVSAVLSSHPPDSSPGGERAERARRSSSVCTNQGASVRIGQACQYATHRTLQIVTPGPSSHTCAHPIALVTLRAPRGARHRSRRAGCAGLRPHVGLVGQQVIETLVLRNL